MHNDLYRDTMTIVSVKIASFYMIIHADRIGRKQNMRHVKVPQDGRNYTENLIKTIFQNTISKEGFQQ